MGAFATVEFAGRTAVIATMHRKEDAIAPILETHLGITTQVPPDFNTDQFGTFTREVKRPADQLATARLKAQAALDLTGATLAIASEGSFGPHPHLPLVPCDREVVMLIDRQHNLEIVGQTISLETNHRAQTVPSVEAAVQFAKTIGFPQHGVVVMAIAADQSTQPIAKGITTEADLQATVQQALRQSPSGQVQIESDLRALYNPTRMQVIAAATQDLVEAIARRCPECQCPGFSPTKHKPGLPCDNCGTPTLLTLAIVHQCQRCQFRREERFPEGRSVADPGQCPFCNP